jgi:cytochrome b involved in lipid metabolism
MIYKAGYYIVTSYVNAHPGGKSVFSASTCGVDVTAYLSGAASTAGQKHTHSSSAYSILQSYYVGPVK